MEVGDREPFKTHVAELSNYFQLARQVRSFQGLRDAIFLYFIEDAAFFKEARYNKSAKVLNIFRKHCSDSRCYEMLRSSTEVLNRLYNTDDFAVINDIILNQKFKELFNQVFNVGTNFSTSRVDEDLLLRFCSRILECNIFIFVNLYEARRYLFASSSTNIYIYKDLNYSILYPYVNCYIEAAKLFERGDLINTKLVENNQRFDYNQLIKKNSQVPNRKIPDSLRGSLYMNRAQPPPLNLRASDNKNKANESSSHISEYVSQEKIQVAPVQAIIKELPKCQKCKTPNANSQMFTLGCSHNICYLCIEDNFFQKSKYGCPSCNGKIGPEMRMNLIDFIRTVHKSQCNVEKKSYKLGY